MKAKEQIDALIESITNSGFKVVSRESGTLPSGSTTEVFEVESKCGEVTCTKRVMIAWHEAQRNGMCCIQCPHTVELFAVSSGGHSAMRCPGDIVLFDDLKDRAIKAVAHAAEHQDKEKFKAETDALELEYRMRSAMRAMDEPPRPEEG